MATETRAKTVVKLTPKEAAEEAVARRDANHPTIIERYRNHAARITRTAVERYLTSKADYEAVLKNRGEIDELLPPPPREQVTGEVKLTDEQHARYNERQAWEKFYDAVFNQHWDTLNFLLHTIVRWDPAYDIDDPNLNGCPRRGIICDGVLYLAVPDDEEDIASQGRPALHVLPLDSIVNLDS